MPCLPRMGNDLLNLGRRDVPRIDPTYPSSFAMDLQHDLRGRLAILLEILLDHHHDELHRGEVVVQQHHLVHRRRLQLLLLAFQDGTVLLVRDNRHTPILNNSDRPAILPLPDRPAGALPGIPEHAIAFAPYESRLRCRLSRVARNTNRQGESHRNVVSASSIPQAGTTRTRVTRAWYMSRLCGFSSPRAWPHAARQSRKNPENGFFTTTL